MWLPGRLLWLEAPEISQEVYAGGTYGTTSQITHFRYAVSGTFNKTG
jgi:hypothetical protein